MESVRLGRDFSTLWAASAISNLGDGVRLVALPLFATTLTRDPVLISLVEASIWLPWLFFALPGGALIDRLERLSIMRNAQLARMLVMLSLVAATLAGIVSIPALCIVAFLVGVGEIFVDGATQAVVPELVRNSDLERANGRLIGSQFAFDQFAGPPIGAFLYSLHQAAPFALDAASFGVSWLLIIVLRWGAPVPVPSASSARLRTEIVEGLRWTWTSPLIRAATLGVTATNFTSSMWGAILVLYVLEELGGSAVDFGIVISAAAVGGLLGTIVASRIARAIGRHRSLTLTLLASGIAALFMGLATDLLSLVIAQALFGFTIGAFNVIGRSLRQSVVPGRLLGRVVSVARLVGYGVIPLGALAGGWLAGSYGLRVPFYVGGFGVVVVGLVLPRWINERTIEAALSDPS